MSKYTTNRLLSFFVLGPREHLGSKVPKFGCSWENDNITPPPPKKKGRHLSPCKFVMVILLTGSFACVFFYIYFDFINLIYNNESRRLIISMNFYVAYWVYNTMNTHSANRENVKHFGYYKSTALIKWGIYIYIAYSTNDLHYG